MISYFIIGFIGAGFIFIIASDRLPRIAKVSGSVVVLAVFIWYALQLTSNTFMGDEPWFARDPYRLVILYAIMSLGMLSSVLVKAISDRRKKIAQLGDNEDPNQVGLSIDKYELLFPFLFSLMTFGALFQQIEDQALGVVSITLAYQTGFFWDTIIKSLKSKVQG